MKLRKALVAAATALTVATAGTVVANAEESTPTTPTATASSFEGSSTDGGDDTTEDPSAGLSSDIDFKDQDQADNIKSWIGVFTAVITALGAAFAFITKYFV